jgi:HlyD family secretion protein
MRKFLVGFAICFVALCVVLTWSIVRQKQEAHSGAESSGVIDAVKVSLTARVTATIARLNFAEGSSVRTGDVMAEFNCDDLHALHTSVLAKADAAEAQFNALRAQSGAQLLQASAANETTESQKAQVESLRVLEEQAKRESIRTESLYKDKVVNEASVEASNSAVNDLQKKITAAEKSVQAATLNAQAARKQAESSAAQVVSLQKQAQAVALEAERTSIALKDCRLVAPQDGVVSLRVREVGEAVAPGMLVYEIRDLSQLKVRFFIHNSSLPKVAVGSAVSVAVDGISDRRFVAHVSRIAEEASFTPRSVQTKDDRDRLVYAAEAMIVDKKRELRPGMSVEVFLENR